MKTLDKILIVIVLICIAVIVYMGQSIKKSEIAFRRAIDENVTLRDALANPKIVEKPVIRYIKVTETTTPAKIVNRPATVNIPVAKKVTETFEHIGEKIREAVLPKIDTVTVQKPIKNWTLSGQYFADSDLVISGARRIFKHLDFSLGISGGANIDTGKTKFGAIALIRF